MLLSSLDTDSLLALLAKASIRSSGFGGKTAQLDVNEIPVFVKLVPATDLELDAYNRLSTANIFQLPLYYQYGIGSVGFGVWRELASHVLTSSWVLHGQHGQFPLLYHWRIIPSSDAAPTNTEAYEYLAHGAAVAKDAPALRRRLDAIQSSRAYVAVFTECFPKTLSEWLSEQLRASVSSANDALAMVQRQSSEAFHFMQGQSFVHFDAHFDNILTDGLHIYFADYGLAMHTSFDLAADEREFLASHAQYDMARFSSSLVHTVCRAIPGGGSWREKVRRLELEPGLLVPAAVAVLRQHKTTAEHMARFTRTLIDTDRQADFSVSAASAN